jgi:GTPase SAR1 family protein
MPELPIVVLGSGAVGKSCIAIQYVIGNFVDVYDATIEDIYRKAISVDGTPEMVTLVDTAGQDAFGATAMRENYMRSGRGFVLVFSITDAESLQKLKAIYTQLARVRSTSGDGFFPINQKQQQTQQQPSNTIIPCVLIGNKADLSAQRVVSPEQGKEFARHINCHYFELSARDKGQVEEVFTYLIRCVRNPLLQQRLHLQQQQNNPNMDSHSQQQLLLRSRSGTIASSGSGGSGGSNSMNLGRLSGATVVTSSSSSNGPPRPNYADYDYNGDEATAVATPVQKKKPAVQRGGVRCVIG